MPRRSSQTVPTAEEPLLSGRARLARTESAEAYWIDWFSAQSGLMWDCVDARTGQLVAGADPHKIPYSSPSFRARLSLGQTPVFYSEDGMLVEVAIPLPGMVGNGLALTSYFLTSPQARPLELTLAAVEAGWSNVEIQTFFDRVPTMSLAVGQHLITALLDKVRLESRDSALEHEIGALSQQLENSYNEVTLLHGLMEHLNLVHSVHDLANLCLQRVHHLIDAAGHLLMIADERGATHCLIEGNVPFTADDVPRLTQFLDQNTGSRTFVRNDLDSVLVDETFPELESLVAAAIGDGAHRRGWIVSCNLRYGHFGLPEANLLNTVARLLYTHVQNQHLFNEQDELLVDFVRTLVSTLDAKDPYTRGHSERVALVARRLAEQMELSEGEQNDIYLSSLLHDIGKVGVDDRILRKPDQLTAEEFAQIQRHPDIGYEILKPLKHLQPILPGVRSHHEAYNGRGYPQGLAGEAIPLMARIIAVADSYDAMSSNRPYRRGMPLGRVEEIFRRGAGEQWDPQVIAAYFAVRDDIQALCESYSLSDGNLLDDTDPSIWGSLSKRSRHLCAQSFFVDPRRTSSGASSSDSTVILSHRPQTR